MRFSLEDEPLLWWKSEYVWYPVLGKVAKKFLCLCATSVPSERVFSCAGHIVSDSRTHREWTVYCFWHSDTMCSVTEFLPEFLILSTYFGLLCTLHCLDV